jgi:hypothetical protein
MENRRVAPSLLNGIPTRRCAAVQSYLQRSRRWKNDFSLSE